MLDELKITINLLYKTLFSMVSGLCRKGRPERLAPYDTTVRKNFVSRAKDDELIPSMKKHLLCTFNPYRRHKNYERFNRVSLANNGHYTLMDQLDIDHVCDNHNICQ